MQEFGWAGDRHDFDRYILFICIIFSSLVEFLVPSGIRVHRFNFCLPNFSKLWKRLDINLIFVTNFLIISWFSCINDFTLLKVVNNSHLQLPNISFFNILLSLYIPIHFFQFAGHFDQSAATLELAAILFLYFQLIDIKVIYVFVGCSSFIGRLLALRIVGGLVWQHWGCLFKGTELVIFIFWVDYVLVIIWDY